METATSRRLSVRKWALAALCLAPSSACIVAGAAQPRAPDAITTLEEFEDHVEELMDEGDTPGLNVAVVHRGELVYHRAFGWADEPRSRPSTNETVYHWWSLSKPVTAMAVLQLRDRGHLRLDDHVSTHLPEFSAARKGRTVHDITVAQLLDHSSGIPDAGFEIVGWVDFEPGVAPSARDFLAEVWDDYDELRCTPGREGRYSNIGYMVLAALVEAVSGRRFEDYLREEVLEPLAMTRTDFRPTATMADDLAVGTHPRDLVSSMAFRRVPPESLVRERVDDVYWFNPVYNRQRGATGLMGSAGDYAKLMTIWLDEGRSGHPAGLSPESTKIFFAPTVEVEHSPAPNISGMRFTSGWFRYEHEGDVALAHGGEGPGFVSHVRLYPERELGIVVMSNGTYLGQDMGHSVVDLAASLDWELAREDRG